MFALCKSNSPESYLATPEGLDQLIHSDRTIAKNAEICKLIEALPADASLKEMDDLHKKIGIIKSGRFPNESLPVACFHAYFKDNKRSNESAVPSGLISLDLDKVENPREMFDALRDNAIAHQLALAFVTPSLHGLKLVMVVPEGCMTVKDAQAQLAKELGVESYFDAGTYDMSRTAFMVPESYFLYRDDQILFGEHQVPEGFGTETDAEKRDRKEVENDYEPVGNVPENELSKHFVDGISYEELLTRLCQQRCGQSQPTEGMRNEFLYSATKVMRVYMNDDLELAKRVMPMWGLPAQEWWNTLRSAHRRAISAAAYKEADDLLRALKREKAIERGEAALTLPPVPENLPPVFREFNRVTPPELQPAVQMSLLPILGFYGTYTKANFAAPDEEPEMRTPSFIVMIIAPPASQKSVITNVYNRLTGKLRKAELPLLAQLNKHNANKQKEPMPDQPIRLMPERLSLSSLSQQLEMAKGQHLMLFTPEIETLKSSNGSGCWNDLSTVFRKSTDNDLLGQIYLSGESHCCNVPVYLNMLIEAQPEPMHEFMGKKNILNGLADRVIPVELPDSTGCRKLKVKKMSDFEWSVIEKKIEYLKSLGEVIKPAEFDDEGNLLVPAEIGRKVLSLPRCRKELEKWGLKHQDHYLQNLENHAEDHYMRRAKMLAFHAAMVAYMVSGNKETKAVVDFALWVAEYILQSQMLQFGQTWNDLHNKREDDHTARVIAINNDSRFSLFDELPDEFETTDLQQVMQAHGKVLSNPNKNINVWYKSGLIELAGTNGRIKRWRKVKGNDVV